MQSQHDGESLFQELERNFPLILMVRIWLRYWRHRGGCWQTEPFQLLTSPRPGPDPCRWPVLWGSAALLQLCTYISQAWRATPNTSGETLRPQDCTLTPGLLQLRASERAQRLLLALAPATMWTSATGPRHHTGTDRNRRRQPSLNAPFQHCPVSPSQSNQNQK